MDIIRFIYLLFWHLVCLNSSVSLGKCRWWLQSNFVAKPSRTTSLEGIVAPVVWNPTSLWWCSISRGRCYGWWGLARSGFENRTRRDCFRLCVVLREWLPVVSKEFWTEWRNLLMSLLLLLLEQWCSELPSIWREKRPWIKLLLLWRLLVEKRRM